MSESNKDGTEQLREYMQSIIEQTQGANWNDARSEYICEAVKVLDDHHRDLFISSFKAVSDALNISKKSLKQASSALRFQVNNVRPFQDIPESMPSKKYDSCFNASDIAKYNRINIEDRFKVGKSSLVPDNAPLHPDFFTQKGHL